MIQILESRRLLSQVSLTSTGTLHLVGTSGADDVAMKINSSGRTIGVSMGTPEGERVSIGNFRLNEIRRVRVEAAGGDDFINLGGVPQIPSVLLGGNGNDSIFASPGEAVVSGGAGNDRIVSGTSTDQLSGTESAEQQSIGQQLIGGAGNDTLLGSSRVDAFNGGKGDDLAVDRLIDRSAIEGRAAGNVRDNLGSRGINLEGFDLASQGDSDDADDSETPLQNQTPPAFENPNPSTPGGGSIFDNPGGSGGSIFDGGSSSGGLFA